MDFDAIDRDYCYDGPLGAQYSKDKTVFRVWAPCAEDAVLKLYPDCVTWDPSLVCPMKNNNGVWEAEAEGDLHGVYYSYTITYNGVARETIDIYARSSGVNGYRGMVLDFSRTDPEGWGDSQRVKLENYTDAVIYELHVRDFSADTAGAFTNRGKFLAFTEENVTNSYGDVIGLDYIASLGVTHIHLLPVFDFETVDEGSDHPAYNWGYDPMNYNALEGSYSSNSFDGSTRVKEFKELVLAAHKRGLGVIMDVVYNHTYSTDNSCFTKTFPEYYYRQANGGYSNGSGCGNEFASERKMASRYIIDSLCWLCTEYKLDGFRFDLMGLLDIETINEAARRLREIDPDIILYGEGWTGGASALDESLRAVRGNVRRIPEYAVFSDEFRDIVKGNVFDDRNTGYINGGHGWSGEAVRTAMCGGIYHPQLSRPLEHCITDSPCQTVNYVEAHDNLTFCDKLRLSMPSASEHEIYTADKLGAALVFFSQGIPFMQAGQEFLRSKPLPHGGFEHNSYNSPDMINSIKWDQLRINRPLVLYYKGLIAIRKKFPEFRLSTGDQIRSQVSFEDLGEGAFIARIGRFTLVVNPFWHDIRFKASGMVYADKDYASTEPLYRVTGDVVCRRRGIMLIMNEGETE
ncbi:MAG: type I pullulanase [Ruminococcus sp.]|nr:type I pullulanase [Ruminococcus sp.]